MKMNSLKDIKIQFENDDLIDSTVENFQYRYIAKIINQQEKKGDKDRPSHQRTICVEYFECHTCKKHCFSKKKLIEHLNQHESEIHKCTQCERTFALKNSLSYHMKSHAGVKYECDICNRKFNDKSNMKKHRNIHLNIRKYKCTSCPKAFSDPNSFKCHLEKHAGVKFKCNFCDKTYSRLYLKTHIKKNHLNIIPSFNCDTCSISFKNKVEQIEHKNRHHLNVQFECHLCQKIFFLKSQLKEHIVTHPEMNIKCMICNKFFDVYQRYIDHQRIHLPHLKCPYCPKQIKGGRSYLNEHIRNSHTNRNYCPICGKYLSSKPILRNHLMRHQGINPRKGKIRPKLKDEQSKFECFTCGKIYNVKESLINHIGVVHSQIDPIPCDICEHVSPSPQSHYEHEANHPLMEYQCKYCTELFFDHNIFKGHLIKHCNKILSNDSWKNHVKKFIHKNKFQCNSCGKTCRAKQNLKIHIKLVHAEKMFKCHLCKRKFGFLRDLRQHMAVHEGIKYKCYSCNKCFDAQFILRDHLRSTKCLVKSSSET